MDRVTYLKDESARFFSLYLPLYLFLFLSLSHFLWCFWWKTKLIQYTCTTVNRIAWKNFRKDTCWYWQWRHKKLPFCFYFFFSRCCCCYCWLFGMCSFLCMWLYLVAGWLLVFLFLSFCLFCTMSAAIAVIAAVAHSSRSLACYLMFCFHSLASFYF